ncbi:MAG: aminoacyl-tRNA hydrolase [Planctomycetaceae bacterium]|jgi:ribosome-associated protein|nr:aminoacyl-tRNA hydrolase [Planctomycetaceae bacterium]
MIIINSTLKIPFDEIQFSYARSSGPGGQNVNKVSSKAVLRWSPAKLTESEIERLRELYPRYWSTSSGEIVISSQRYRDAIKNKSDCLDKFVAMLGEVVKKKKKRIPTKPTKNSIKRRLENKSKNSAKKRNREGIINED